MICDTCINVIIRTFQNGAGQDPYKVRVCSLDGLTVTHQLVECNRRPKEEATVVETEIRLPELELPPLDSPTSENFNPLPAKKRGNPNWSKRGT